MSRRLLIVNVLLGIVSVALATGIPTDVSAEVIINGMLFDKVVVPAGTIGAVVDLATLVPHLHVGDQIHFVDVAAHQRSEQQVAQGGDRVHIGRL